MYSRSQFLVWMDSSLAEWEQVQLFGLDLQGMQEKQIYRTDLSREMSCKGSSPESLQYQIQPDLNLELPSTQSLWDF